MSLFNKPQNPENDPSEDRLREWGDGERTLPPIRRGRFANIADRLTRGVSSASSQTPWYRPALALGGVSLVAVTVGFAALNRPLPVETKSAVVSQTAQPMSNSGGRAFSTIRGDAKAWTDKLTKYGDGVAVRTDPVFINSDNYGATTGCRNSAVVPFVVTVRNDGETFTGKITVSIGDMPGRGRTYTYPITVSGSSTLRTTIYPEMALDGNRYAYDIRLDTPKHRRIALNSGYVRSGSNNGYGNFEAGRKSVAILDERIGVLSPRRSSGSARDNGGQYLTLYAKPSNAPDRAIGYDAVDVLVLGYGCEKLDDTQWAAIREWVKDGGSLVLLGGSEEMRRVLATPAALALSPAEQFAAETRTATPHLKVTHFDMHPLENGYFNYDYDLTRLFPNTLSTIPGLKADAKILFLSPMREKTQWATVGARRTLGAGSVAFYGFDPTVTTFRDAPASLIKWWGDVARYDKGAIPSQQMRMQATSGRNRDNEVYHGNLARAVSRNPFITQLPDLRIVLYIFLGYFVLVVPVSFVVLKQTRRMHYAWFTGPLLAVTFAGGLALFTRSLYEASQSLRTSGIIALEAGDGVGRFHGVTELYVPKSGRFSLNLPGTQVSFSGSNEYYGGEPTTFLPDISDNGSGEQPPVIDVQNLAFRRFHHSQTVTLGKGISATLHPRAKGSHSLAWTITNNTGLTLRSASIMMRDKNTVFHNGATYIPIWVWSGHNLDLPPGDTRVVLARRDFGKQEGVPGQTEIFHQEAASLPPCTPMLTASVSGETFAPKQLGRWVGGDRSVKIIVKLPALREDLMPKYVRSEPPGAPGGPPPPGFGGPARQGGNTR